jgi:type I restriction enzyme S subunit
VAKVEELVAKIEEARGLRQSSAIARDRIIATSLKSVFDRDLIGQMQEALPLAQAARVSRGKFTHRPRNEPRFYGGDVPFIQINDISSSKRYISRYSQTLNEHGLKISRLFPAGTVVIAITGATVGVMGILAIDSCFPDSIVGIEAYPEKTLPEYVYWALEHVKSNALAEATQTTQPNINLKILNRLSIPVPPLPEQRRIVAYLDDLQAKVDSLKALQAQTQAELDALLPSILDKAFKGEL